MRNQNTQSQQVRLFQSERLEKFTMVSLSGFLKVWAIALPLIIWLAWGTATPLAAAGLILLGGAIWTFFEYAMHRYLFHWKPGAAWFESFVFIMHGNHHDHANDPMRNLMPPIASFPIAGAVWAVCVLLAGPVGTWVFFGFITGYVFYDLTHYACHQWPMRGRLGHMIKRHHMRHHHLRQEGNYAITALFWDKIMGTAITAIRPRAKSEASAER